MAHRFGHLKHSDLHSAWMEWWKNWYINKGLVPRFGQHMVNTHLHDGDPWTELFYCENQCDAYAMIANEIYKG